MRKVLCFVLSMVLTVCLCSCTPARPTPNHTQLPKKHKIALVVGEAPQSVEYRTALQLKEKYQGRVVLFSYSLPETPEGIAAAISAAANNTEIKVIAAVSAPVDTADAFRAVREKREDVLLIAGACTEPPEEIAEAIDIGLQVNEQADAVAMVKQAAEMGAETFVHIACKRHRGYNSGMVTQSKFEDACAANGLNYVRATVPDALEEPEKAAEWVKRNVPYYVQKYGVDTAFYSPCCSLQEHLIREVMNKRAILPQTCCTSPFCGYPEALEIDMTGHETDTAYLFEQIRLSVADKNNTGRMSSWGTDMRTVMLQLAVEYGIAWSEGKCNSRCDVDKLKNYLLAQTGPDTVFAPYSDSNTPGIPNFFTVLCPYETF